MRILLLGDYPPDPTLGSTKVFVKLQEEFRALGHTCDLILGDAMHAPRNPYIRRALAPISAVAAAWRIARRSGPYDVIDVTSAEGIWIGALRRTVWKGTRVISRSNGLEHLNYQRMLDDHAEGLMYKPWTRRIFHPLARLSQVAGAARLADRLLILNETDRAYAIRRRWKRPEDIDVVPHGVSARFIADAPPPDQPRGGGILFCSSWADMKGVPYLANAFAQLIAEGLDVNLTLLGGGRPEAEEFRKSFQAFVQGHLTVIERAPEDELMAAYRSHDVMVLPSTYEGFGMVTIEAMSQRLPVVATPVGAALSVIVDGRTGLLVPLRDSHALAAALKRMLLDDGLRARCAEAAFERVREMTWTRTAEVTLDVYRRALSGPGPAPLAEPTGEGQPQHGR